MKNDVCGRRERSVQEAGWWEPDEVWCPLKTGPSLLIWNEETLGQKWSVSNKRWKRQEVVHESRQRPCQHPWCWYGRWLCGSRWADMRRGRRRQGGRRRRCIRDNTWRRTKDTLTPCFVHTLITGRQSSESCHNKDKQVDSSTLAAFRQWDL